MTPNTICLYVGDVPTYVEPEPMKSSHVISIKEVAGLHWPKSVIEYVVDEMYTYTQQAIFNGYWTRRPDRRSTPMNSMPIGDPYDRYAEMADDDFSEFILFYYHTIILFCYMS